MFQALGRGVVKNADNTFTVKVEFLDDRTQKQVRVQAFTVQTVPALRAAVQAELVALKAAEQDAALNAAIVGVVLGEI